MSTKNITIFGGSGFVGRHIVRKLAAAGHRIRVAVRDPERGMLLKPMGDVGQIALMQANIRNEASIRRAIAGADVVINLVGIMFPRGAQSFQAVQTEGAGKIAQVAADAGVQQLIHISALGCDKAETCKYAKSKKAGEAAVTAAFPKAVILRPSVIFGPEDKFFNLFASLARFLPIMPAFGTGATKLQPVYVNDVAEAVCRVLSDPDCAGQTYEIAGGEVVTLKEIMALTCEMIGRQRLILPMPYAIASIQGALLQMTPWPLLTMDQVEALKYDNVASGDLPGLAELGITPEPMESILPTYLYRYRRAGKLSESRLG